jgi:hypothetical protein
VGGTSPPVTAPSPPTLASYLPAELSSPQLEPDGTGSVSAGSDAPQPLHLTNSYTQQQQQQQQQQQYSYGNSSSGSYSGDVTSSSAAVAAVPLQLKKAIIDRIIVTLRAAGRRGLLGSRLTTEFGQVQVCAQKPLASTSSMCSLAISGLWSLVAS